MKLNRKSLYLVQEQEQTSAISYMYIAPKAKVWTEALKGFQGESAINKSWAKPSLIHVRMGFSLTSELGIR